MAIEKESLTHLIEDDLELRNRNWSAVGTHLAEKASDNVHGLKPESPISITLLNGWTNQSISAYGEASYYKDAFGLVHLQGTIKAPSGNRTLTIFNLPQGYRPSRRKHLLVANATQVSAGIMSITSDGDVNIESTTGDGNVISLNTVSFKASE